MEKAACAVELESKLKALSLCSDILALPRKDMLTLKRYLIAELTSMKNDVAAAKEELASARKDIADCKVIMKQIEVLKDLSSKVGSALPAAQSVEGQPAELAKNPNDVPAIEVIPEAEWEGVPRYLRLRLRWHEVNNFINVFNQQLVKKYTLLKKKPASLNGRLVQMRQVHRSAETPETKGLYFLVNQDLMKVVKSQRAVLNMTAILRHCRRIREIRSQNLIRFVVC